MIVSTVGRLMKPHLGSYRISSDQEFEHAHWGLDRHTRCRRGTWPSRGAICRRDGIEGHRCRHRRGKEEADQPYAMEGIRAYSY